MGVLADIGRSGRVRGLVQRVTDFRRGLEEEKRSKESFALSQETGQVQLENLKMQQEQLKERKKLFNTVIPVASLQNSVQSPGVWDYMSKLAESHGYVDKSNPNNPVIKAGHASHMGQLLSEPFHAKQLIRIQENETINKLTEINEQIGQITQKKSGTDLKYDKNYVRLVTQQQTLQNRLGIFSNKREQLGGLIMGLAEKGVYTPKSLQNYMESGDSSVLKIDPKNLQKLSQPKEKTGTDFERAYRQFIQQPGNEGVTRVDFKDKYWKKTTEGGKLTEGEVRKHIDEISNYDPEKSAQSYSRYLEYRRAEMSREEALEAVDRELLEGNIEGEGDEDFSSLWGE